MLTAAGSARPLAAEGAHAADSLPAPVTANSGSTLKFIRKGDKLEIRMK